MRLWLPNRKQWWVIWVVYGVVFVVNYPRMDRGDGEQLFTQFLVVGGALLVWRFTGQTSNRPRTTADDAAADEIAWLRQDVWQVRDLLAEIRDLLRER